MLLKSISIVQYALSNFWFPFLSSGYQKKDIVILSTDLLVETREFCLSFNITSCVLWLFCSWRYCYVPIWSGDLNDEEIWQCYSAHVQRFSFLRIYFFKHVNCLHRPFSSSRAYSVSNSRSFLGCLAFSKWNYMQDVVQCPVSLNTAHISLCHSDWSLAQTGCQQEWSPWLFQAVCIPNAHLLHCHLAAYALFLPQSFLMWSYRAPGPSTAAVWNGLLDTWDA